MQVSRGARTIVISGGGREIGRAVGLLCAQLGDNVVILDRHANAAKEAADEMLARGAAGAMGTPCDVSDEIQVESAYKEAYRRFGPPHGIFANAGIDAGGRIHSGEIAGLTESEAKTQHDEVERPRYEGREDVGERPPADRQDKTHSASDPIKKAPHDELSKTISHKKGR